MDDEFTDWLLADVRVQPEVKLIVAAAEEEEPLIDRILYANESINSGTVAVENTNISSETNAIVPREDKDSVGGDRKQESITPTSKRRKSKEKWMNLPRRSSKRLARLGTDSALESESSDVAREAAPTPQVDTTENTAGKSHEINSSSQVHQNIVGNELKDNNGEEIDQSILNVVLADPSIDFAFKILTDVIPIEEYLNKVSVASPDPTSGSSSAVPFGDT